jgi:hypothetical protein
MTDESAPPRGGKPDDKSKSFRDFIRAAIKNGYRTDHLHDAAIYGMGAYQTTHDPAGHPKYQYVPFEDIFEKAPPPPPPGEMSKAEFRAWMGENELEFEDDFGDEKIIAYRKGKTLATFDKMDLAVKLGSQERIHHHIWATLEPILKEARRYEIHSSSINRQKFFEEAMQRMRQQQAWEEALRGRHTGNAGPSRQPKTFTAEQRAGMEKARKVKRMMEHTNNEGIRANARSSLDTLLEKHGITEADL